MNVHLVTASIFSVEYILDVYISVVMFVYMYEVHFPWEQSI